MSRYVVTGGAGFIGSAIARRLIAEGHDVVIFDNLKTGLKKNLPEQAAFHHVDLGRMGDLERIKIEDVAAILHLGAQSSGEISHDDPDYDLASNAAGTRNMLEWGHRQGVRRFLNASSMGVYGQVPADQCPVCEDRFLSPSSYYGISKLAGEKFCELFQAKGLETTSFRMFNVYGPGQNMDNMKQGMVSIYLAYLLKSEPIIVKGSLERFRDFVFIDDVVAAWVAAIHHPQAVNKVWNLATGKKTFVRDIVTVLVDIGKKRGLNTSVQVADAGTPGDQHGIYANCDAIAQAIGWRAKTSIHDGLSAMLNYYL